MANGHIIFNVEYRRCQFPYYFLGNKNEALPRRFFLRHLGKQLLQKHLQRRITITCLPQTITSRVKEILGKTDPPNTRENSVSNNSSRLAQVRKRCFSCQKEKKTRLTRYSCHTYQKYLCLAHCAFIYPDGCNTSDATLEENPEEMQL